MMANEEKSAEQEQLQKEVDAFCNSIKVLGNSKYMSENVTAKDMLELCKKLKRLYTDSLLYERKDSLGDFVRAQAQRFRYFSELLTDIDGDKIGHLGRLRLHHWIPLPPELCPYMRDLSAPVYACANQIFDILQSEIGPAFNHFDELMKQVPLGYSLGATEFDKLLGEYSSEPGRDKLKACRTATEKAESTWREIPNHTTAAAYVDALKAEYEAAKCFVTDEWEAARWTIYLCKNLQAADRLFDQPRSKDYVKRLSEAMLIKGENKGRLSKLKKSYEERIKEVTTEDVMDVSGKVIRTRGGKRYKLTSKIPNDLLDQEWTVSTDMVRGIAIVNDTCICRSENHFKISYLMNFKKMLGDNCVKYFKKRGVDVYYAQPI